MRLPFVLILSGLALIGIGGIQLIKKPTTSAEPAGGDEPSFSPQKTKTE